MPPKNFKNSAFMNSSGTGSKSSFLAQLGSGLTALEEAYKLPLDQLEPNDFQIRQSYDQESLNELAEDIKLRGILQPLLVRQLPKGVYQIIAGERRYRAAQIAGLTEVPVVVLELTDQAARFTMLVENIQRKDLEPTDEKRFFEELQNLYNFSQKEIAKLINKSPAYVNKRLLGEEAIGSGKPSVNDSEEFHNNSQNKSLLEKSQLNNPKQASQNTSANKSTGFRFNLATIDKLANNLSVAREAFSQEDMRPSPTKTKQIKQSLELLKKQIAELEKTLENAE